MLKMIKHYAAGILEEYRPLFKNTAILKIVTAGFVSQLGSKISYFALLRKVYELSNGKITDLGFLAVFEALPYIIFGALAGIIIDKFQRKRIMIISDMISGIITLSILFLNNLQIIYLMTFMASFVNVFRNPAQRAFEPNLVEKENIPLLNSFISMTNSLTMIIGSALGAAVVGFAGATSAFILDAVSFYLSSIIIFTIFIKETHMEEKKNITVSGHLKEFVDGISIMWQDSTLKLILIINLYVTFAMSMQAPLIYIFLRQTLHLGYRAEVAWGTLLSSLGVGAVLGSFIIGILVKKYNNKFRLFLNILLFDSIFFTTFLINRFFPLSIVLFGFLGCIGTAHAIILNSTIQSTVSDENRGKVFSTFSMLSSPISIISILVGTVAAEYITALNVLLLVAGLEAVIALGVRAGKTYRLIDKALINSDALNQAE